jgi:hypothetical protein
MIQERRCFHPERGWGTVSEARVTSMQLRDVPMVAVLFDDGTSDVTPRDGLHFGPLSKGQLLDTLMVWAGGAVGWSANDGAAA